MLHNDPRDPRNEPGFTRSELIAAGYFYCADCEEFSTPREYNHDETTDEEVCTFCFNRRQKICTEDDICIEGGIIYLKGYPWKRVNEL